MAAGIRYEKDEEEQDMPKVSVLMPSLNVAAYIRECMDSVVGQTLKDMEILCIDAGSTDGTLDILREYQERDSRIRVLVSEKKSYGYQMNLGLREAKGEYIGIVETDDYVEPEMYEELYEKAAEWDADFVKSDFDVFTTMQNGQRLFLRYSLGRYNKAEYDKPVTYKDYLSGAKTVDIFTWNGIYKKAFLEKNHILFQETPGAAYQDCGFRYQTAVWVRCGIFIKRSYYRYRRDNAESSMYNRKAVIFNLAEHKYLTGIAWRDHWDQERVAFLAREAVFIAMSPYIDLLSWTEPAEGTKEAVDEFRGILQTYIDEGLLSSRINVWAPWLELRLFIEDPDCFRRYTAIKNKLKEEQNMLLFDAVASHKEVVLFGSGYVGACAYCRLRVNGAEHVMAFCDNNVSKWNTVYMGIQVLPPSEAIQKFPNACYVVASLTHGAEICKQLFSYGVRREQIIVYESSTFPIDCTNIYKNAGRKQEKWNRQKNS